MVRCRAQLDAYSERFGKAGLGFDEPTGRVQRLAEMLHKRRATQSIVLGLDQARVLRFGLAEVALIAASIGKQGDESPIVGGLHEQLAELSFGLCWPPIEERNERFDRRVVCVRGPERNLVVQYRHQRIRVVVPALRHKPKR